jgi:predicted phage-related endonuclease
MLRGHQDEIYAKVHYNEKYAPLDECGFITNDEFGFTLGYSPDALVRGGGQIECKSRRQKFQVEAIVADILPEEYKLQVQTGLLVSGEPWCDFITYCGGMPMMTKRIEPDKEIQDAILIAAHLFHKEIEKVMIVYQMRLADPTVRLIPTERIIEQEMHL